MVRQGKKWHKIWKGRNKFLFSADRIICMENLKECANKFLKIKRTFMAAIWCKIKTEQLHFYISASKS